MEWARYRLRRRQCSMLQKEVLCYRLVNFFHMQITFAAVQFLSYFQKVMASLPDIDVTPIVQNKSNNDEEENAGAWVSWLMREDMQVCFLVVFIASQPWFSGTRSLYWRLQQSTACSSRAMRSRSPRKKKPKKMKEWIISKLRRTPFCVLCCTNKNKYLGCSVVFHPRCT